MARRLQTVGQGVLGLGSRGGRDRNKDGSRGGRVRGNSPYNLTCPELVGGLGVVYLDLLLIEPLQFLRLLEESVSSTRELGQQGLLLLQLASHLRWTS